jgi:hypothetical protein
MSQIVQQMFKVSTTGRNVQLSPISACTRDTALPPYLALDQVTLTFTSATPPADFIPASGCQRYIVRVERAN